MHKLKKNQQKVTEREKLIDDLVDDDLNTIQSGEWAYVSDILREGFKGYSNYTMKELKKEHKERFAV